MHWSRGVCLSGGASWCEILGHHFSFRQLLKSLPPFKWSDIWFRVTVFSQNFLASLLSCLWFPFSSSFVSSVFKVFIFSYHVFLLVWFTIGIGDSDSRGSIEQPIMDLDVISISGSSSEDTRRGASNSESSFSKRVKALCRTGGGTSVPRGRTRSSAVAWEPIPVIMILLLSASGGVTRGGGGDVRASPRVGRNHSAGRHRLPLPSLAIIGWGITFWNTSSLSPWQRVLLLFNARWNWRDLRTSASYPFRLVEVMTSRSWEWRRAVHPSILSIGVCLRS